MTATHRGMLFILTLLVRQSTYTVHAANEPIVIDLAQQETTTMDYTVPRERGALVKMPYTALQPGDVYSAQLRVRGFNLFLIFRFIEYYQPKTEPSEFQCEYDCIHLLNRNQYDFFPKGWCKSDGPSSQYNTYDWANISLVNGDEDVDESIKFTAHVAVRLADDSECHQDGWFICRDSSVIECVRDEVKCNGYDDCTDGSDESKATCQSPTSDSDHGLSSGQMAGVLIGVLLVVTIFVAGLAVWLRRRGM